MTTRPFLRSSAARRVAAMVAAVAALAALVAGCGSDGDSSAQVDSGSPSMVTGPQSVSPQGSPTSSVQPSGPAVTFQGVSVTNATQTSVAPAVASTSTTDPTKLEVKDLVVGTGKPATPASVVTVGYVGVRYRDGKQFDSSWSRGGPAAFPLSGVVAGFAQGIAGIDKLTAMKEGGRRIIIVPSALAYGEKGATGSGDVIGPNTPLVFVVDLVEVVN